MQTKNGARHGFSLLSRVRASPIHTHPPTPALFASFCPLFFVCFLSLSKPLVVLYVLLSLLWCGGMRNAFVICPPLVMLMVMAVCVVLVSQWSLFSWSLNIGYVVVAHLTSTVPKRLNSSKIWKASKEAQHFCTSTFPHPASTMSRPVQPSKTCWKGSWSSHDVLPDSITFHISVWGNAYERQDENTQQCSVLVLQDWLRHHRVIILGAINSGLTKHRSYLKFFVFELWNIFDKLRWEQKTVQQNATTKQVACCRNKTQAICSTSH